MGLGGINYNVDTPFSNSKTAEEYIDTAIAKNIQYLNVEDYLKAL